MEGGQLFIGNQLGFAYVERILCIDTRLKTLRIETCSSSHETELFQFHRR